MTTTGPDHAALLRGHIGQALTPRTSQVLYHALRVLADDAYDDAERYRSAPLGEDSQVLGRYPGFTRSCDEAWRRQAARAYDDLADDMAAGIWPYPRCPGEEIAVILAVSWAEDMVRDLPEALGFDGLPVMEEDFDWQMVLDGLMQDMDMELLMDPAWDGAEDPDTDVSRTMHMVDYRPQAWFAGWPEFPERDTTRGFRRSSRCPVTSRPSSFRRQNVVRSGQAKVASGMSRSSG